MLYLNLYKWILNKLQEEFRKLEKEAGAETSSALISIMELRATQFEKDLNNFKESTEKQFSTIQWMIGLGFTILGVLMVLLKIF